MADIRIITYVNHLPDMNLEDVYRDFETIVRECMTHPGQIFTTVVEHPVAGEVVVVYQAESWQQLSDVQQALGEALGGISTMFIGHPGVGKSNIVMEKAREAGLPVQEVVCNEGRLTCWKCYEEFGHMHYDKCTHEEG